MSKKKKKKEYEKLTLREVIDWLRKECETRNEHLTKEKLGSLTVRSIVEKARKCSVRNRRDSCSDRRPRQ